MPSNDLPEAGKIPQLDKIVHFTFYFVWAILLLSTKEVNLPPYITLSLLLLFSFCIEILQLLFPLGRSFSVLDLTANLAGLAAGWVFFSKIK
jgi:VanZ family protein